MTEQGDASTPKLEVKEGKVFVDGKSYVPESDLLANKKSLEKQLDTATTTHATALDAARLSQSEAETQLATANAELIKLRDAQSKGAASTEEVVKAKQEAADAKKLVEETNKSSLELRRQVILATYPGLKLEQIKDKTPAELTAFEEALKAVGASKNGLGAYAFGGGGSGAQPVSAIDRAKLALASTPVRGVRTADTK